MNGATAECVDVMASKSGTVVIVRMDTTDMERIGDRKLSIGSHGYAQMWSPERRVVLLHRWLLGLKVGDRRIGDHIDGDPLNNRRSNLRVVDAVASSCNTRGWASTGYRGVYRIRSGERFVAQARVAGKLTVVGRFDTAEAADEAVHAWRVANMPGYVDRPGARRIGEKREPDADAVWWQILYAAGCAPRRWSLPTVETKYRDRMRHDPSDDAATGWKLGEFLAALKNGEVN